MSTFSAQQEISNDESPNMLCDDCKRIEKELCSAKTMVEQLNPLEERLLRSMPTKISREDFGIAFRTMQWKLSLTELVLSAESGCRLCSFFHHGIQHPKNPRSEPPANGPLLLNRIRNPYKIREYLATGDYLVLVLENAPSENLAELDIFTQGKFGAFESLTGNASSND